MEFATRVAIGRWNRFAIIIAIVAYMAGCAMMPGQIPSTRVPPPDGFVVVRTFFVTDRNRTGSERADEMFGVNRSDQLSYGTCEVSIPASHQAGHIERPSRWRFEFKEYPTKHIILGRTIVTAYFTRT